MHALNYEEGTEGILILILDYPRLPVGIDISENWPVPMVAYEGFSFRITRMTIKRTFISNMPWEE
jgi:hypothetical protein